MNAAARLMNRTVTGPAAAIVRAFYIACLRKQFVDIFVLHSEFRSVDKKGPQGVGGNI